MDTLTKCPFCSFRYSADTVLLFAVLFVPVYFLFFAVRKLSVRRILAVQNAILHSVRLPAGRVHLLGHAVLVQRILGEAHRRVLFDQIGQIRFVVRLLVLILLVVVTAAVAVRVVLIAHHQLGPADGRLLETRDRHPLEDFHGRITDCDPFLFPMGSGE